MPFAPSSLSGLVLWLSADTGLFQDTAGTTPAVANAAPVALWQDQSGAGNHVSQATAGSQPTLTTSFFNGHPGVTFDGSNDTLTRAAVSSIAGSAGATLFWVGTQDSGGEMTVFSLSGVQLDNQAGAQNYFWAPVASYGTDACRIKSARTLAMRFDGSQTGNANRLKAWVSGFADSLTYPGSAIPAALTAGTALAVGSTSTPSAYQWGSTLGVLLYSRALTDAEVAQVHAWVASKWFAGLPSSVLCGGDSLTVSYPHSTTSWPLRLGTLLGAAWTVPDPNVIDTAETGAQVARIATLAANQADTRAQHYRPQDWYCVWAGTNDLATGATAAATFAALQTLAADRKAQGLRMFACTAISRNDTTPGPNWPGFSAFETARTAYNTSILGAAGPSGPWEFVVDLAADPILGTAAATNDPTYSNGDGTHLSQAGYDRVADQVNARLTAFNTPGLSGSPRALLLGVG